MNSPRQRLAVALDTGEWSTYERWCRELAPEVGVLKVGLEAFVRWGHRAVQCATEAAQGGGAAVFLDLKLHDIPNTVAGAVASARDLGVHYLTLHAGGGERMMQAAVAAAGDRMQLLAVTVLTHLDEQELHSLGLPGSAAKRAERWARLAADSGCSGIVCSPHELATLRPQHAPPFKLVTPGIRPSGAAAGDQRRVATPAAAIAAGADLLVIGRPITQQEDPVRAAAAIIAEIAAAGGEPA